MVRARPHPDQIGFVFDPPCATPEPAGLAGLEQRISRGVSTILKHDPRERTVLAALVSDLLGEEFSRPMLDAYASPMREGHKVTMSRFLALVMVTARHDVLDRILREIGAAVLVDGEVLTARLGHIDLQMDALARERKKLKACAPLIRGGTDE